MGVNPENGLPQSVALATPASLSAVRAVTAQPLVPYFAALGARNADVLFIGDSKTEGNAASSVNKRWLDQHAADMRTKWGQTAGGLYVPAWYASAYTNTPNPKWTLAGSTSNSSALGLGLRATTLNATGAQATITATCDRFRLFFTKHFTSSEAVTVQVDGGAQTPVAITTSGASGESRSGFVYDSGAIASAAHTIVVAWSAGAAPTLEGGYFYNTDYGTGYRVWDSGHFGNLVSSFTNLHGNATAPPYAYAIPSIVASGSSLGLVVIAFGTNDWSGNRGSATFGTDLQTMIAQIRTQVTHVPFLILMEEQRTLTGISPTEPYANYVNQAYAIAGADTGGENGGSGVAVLDLTQRMVTADQDNLALHNADLVHYSDKGNRAVADILTGYLAAA